MRFGIVVAAVLMPQIALAQNRAIERAVAAWKNVRSLSGTFEQTLNNPLMRTNTTAKGTFAQQQPNRIAIRFTDPSGDAIVADGKNLWVFLQQAAPGQVLKTPISDRMAAPIDIGQFLDAPLTRYDIVARGADSVG